MTFNVSLPIHTLILLSLDRLFLLILCFIASYFLISKELMILEKLHLVFYYILSSGENEGPIGDPLKVLYVFMLACINTILSLFPQAIVGKIDKRSYLFIIILTGMLIMVSGIQHF